MVTIFWGCCIPYGEVYGKHLGVQGSVYEIQEQDALAWIEEKLTMMQRSGEMTRQQAKFKQQALLSLQRPRSVFGLKPTVRARVFEKDLTITVPFDIKNAMGEIIQRAGTRLNPLKNMLTQKVLIFFDGEDKKQLTWALKQYHAQYGLVKLVLVKGSPLELMQQYEIPFYFDQAGKLTQYFKIEQIPARVYQEKEKLIITEVKM